MLLVPTLPVSALLLGVVLCVFLQVGNTLRVGSFVSHACLSFVFSTREDWGKQGYFLHCAELESSYPVHFDLESER